MMRFGFVLLLGLLACLGAGSLGFMWSDDRPPARVLERVIETTTVRAGEDLIIRTRFIADRRCETHADRYILDSTSVRYDLDPIEFRAGSAPIGQVSDLRQAIPVPYLAAPGPALYRVIPIFKCNALKKLFPVNGEIVDYHFMIAGH